MTRDTAKKVRAAAKRALRGQAKKPTRPRIDGGPKKKKRKTFAAENRERTARQAHSVAVIDGPIPKRKPGKITAGGALTARFELNAQDLRELRPIAIAHGFETPAGWTLKLERKAAQHALPHLVAWAILARRPKAPPE